MSEPISHDRRRFLGSAVIAMAAAELATLGYADAQSREIRPIKPGTITAGIGHNLPQEAPQAFAQAVVDVDGY